MYFKFPVYFVASSAVGGHEEMSSPYASWFDFFHNRDTFGEDTYEKAESELSRIALNFLFNKAGLEPHALSLLISGDLQNQCVASSYGLYTFGVPYLPLYGACSTCTEGLLVGALYLQAVSASDDEKNARRTNGACDTPCVTHGIGIFTQADDEAVKVENAGACVDFRKGNTNDISLQTDDEAVEAENADACVDFCKRSSSDISFQTENESTKEKTAVVSDVICTSTSYEGITRDSAPDASESFIEVEASPACFNRPHYVGVVTTSHNSVAERQFRTPLEYGAERTPTAQWTATAGGAFLLTESRDTPYRLPTPYAVRIVWGRAGKVIDGATSDASNMGAAMAPAARDSIRHFFQSTHFTLSDLDAIVTGDLGEVGSALLLDLLREDGLDIASLHRDCGLCLYDRETQDMHAGASGCGCSASLLSAMVLPRMMSGEWQRVLFLSTGALMSPSSILQGISILGIAPAVLLESEKIL